MTKEAGKDFSEVKELFYTMAEVDRVRESRKNRLMNICVEGGVPPSEGVYLDLLKS